MNECLQRSTAVEILTAGGYPTVTYLWMSTSHNGRVASCRGGVVRLSTNVPINIRLNRGVAYSDNKRQTSWSLFDTVLVALPRSLIYIPYQRPFAVLNEPVSNRHVASCIYDSSFVNWPTLITIRLIVDGSPVGCVAQW